VEKGKAGEAGRGVARRKDIGVWEDGSSLRACKDMGDPTQRALLAGFDPEALAEM